MISPIPTACHLTLNVPDVTVIPNPLSTPAEGSPAPSWQADEAHRQEGIIMRDGGILPPRW